MHCLPDSRRAMKVPCLFPLWYQYLSSGAPNTAELSPWLADCAEH